MLYGKSPRDQEKILWWGREGYVLNTVKFAMETIIFEPFHMKPCHSDQETSRNSHGGGVKKDLIFLTGWGIKIYRKIPFITTRPRENLVVGGGLRVI